MYIYICIDPSYTNLSEASEGYIFLEIKDILYIKINTYQHIVTWI